MPVFSGRTPFHLRGDKHEETNYITLTSGTAAYGAYVELLDETGHQTNYMVLGIDEENTSNEYDIDIAVGAEGSEVNEVTGAHHHVNLAGQNVIALHIPYRVDIPKGARMAARTKATNNTDIIKVKCHLTGTD